MQEVQKNMDVAGILVCLLRREVCGGSADVGIKNALSPQMLQALYALSQKHDLAHLVAQALSGLGVLGTDPLSLEFKKQAMQAVYRYAKQDRDYRQICDAFEEACIPYIPLKGAVLRGFYPEPWMRTSCDIDILVKEAQLDAAAEVLTQKLNFRKEGKNSHDLSLFSPNGTHLELHYWAVDQEFLEQTKPVLMRIWQAAAPKEAGLYCHCLSDEMFYFYHIAHMAKHFENGGCGIRPFLDLWILNHRMEYDREGREALLSQGGMLQFARAAEKLSQVWFSGEEADPLSAKLERFILDGGVYGTLQNSVAVHQAQKGGRLRYALSKIFLPYRIIQYCYPILQKHRWLTPFYEVRRWLRLIFTKDARRSLRTLRTNATISSSEIASTADLMEYLGLS